MNGVEAAGSTEHLRGLDGLRAVAVLLVLVTHVPRQLFDSIVPHLGGALFAGGYVGVDVFFVLSGFLITRILLAERRAGTPVRHFLARRFLRLMPIYYLTLFVIGIIRHDEPIAWCAVYLSNFYFMFDAAPHPLRHTWSLAVEEHFYLLWPLVVSWLSPKRSFAVLRWLILPSTVLMAAVVVLGRESLPANDLIYRGSMFRAWSLGLGALIAYQEPFFRSRRGGWGTGVFALLTGAGLFVVSIKLAPVIWRPVINMVAFSLMSLSALLFVLVPPVRLLGAVMETATMRYIGRVSYGLYLYHYPIYFYFGMFDGSHRGWSSAAGAFVSAFAVAALSFRFIEAPILKLKDRFRSTAARVSAVAPVGGTS